MVNQPGGELAWWWISQVVEQPGGESAGWWIRRVVSPPGDESAGWWVLQVMSPPGWVRRWWVRRVMNPPGTDLDTAGKIMLMCSNLSQIPLNEFRARIIWRLFVRLDPPASIIHQSDLRTFVRDILSRTSLVYQAPIFWNSKWSPRNPNNVPKIKGYEGNNAKIEHVLNASWRLEWWEL